MTSAVGGAPLSTAQGLQLANVTLARELAVHGGNQRRIGPHADGYFDAAIQLDFAVGDGVIQRAANLINGEGTSR